jgi:putative membrane protein
MRYKARLLVNFLMPSMAMIPAMTWAASADQAFYEGAGESGLAEIQAGKLAEDRAVKPELKDFAGMMVKDHSSADAKLWKIAGGAGVTMPKTASVEQTAAAERLKLLNGAAFDKAYIKYQIEAHRDAVALMKKEKAGGQDAAARQFASETLPVVQQHLDGIMKIAGDAGISAD